MSVDWSKKSRHLASAVLLFLASMGWAGRSRAQDHTADPYKPYNQQYEQFVYPTYPTGYGLSPNQGVLEGRSGFSGANQFQRFLEAEGDAGVEFGQGRRRSGPGIPYYSAYRQYDQEYDRVYQPNKTSDESYYKDRNARHEKYVAYLKERDPRKRAELYREYISDSRKVSRDLANPRGTSARRTSASGPSTTKPEDRASGIGTRRGNPTAPAAEGSTRSPLSSGARAGSARPRKPSEVLRDKAELDSPKRSRSLTAPGLAPPSGSPRPR
jgi:hypothetical protein